MQSSNSGIESAPQPYLLFLGDSVISEMKCLTSRGLLSTVITRPNSRTSSASVKNSMFSNNPQCPSIRNTIYRVVVTRDMPFWQILNFWLPSTEIGHYSTSCYSAPLAPSSPLPPNRNSSTTIYQSQMVTSLQRIPTPVCVCVCRSACVCAHV